MDERDAVRRGYDGLAEDYAASRSADGLGTELLEEFLESLSGSARVLDAGCGQGTPVLTRLDETGASAIGLDFSSEQLRLATENAPGASLVQGDMTALPFREDAFDALTAYHSLIHVPLGDHRAVLEEFARVLQPGGRVLLSEGDAEWEGTNPDWLESGVEMRWHIAGADATREQLRETGFRIVDERDVPDKLADEDGDATKPFFAAVLES